MTKTKHLLFIFLFLLLSCTVSGCSSLPLPAPQRENGGEDETSLRVLTIGTADSGGTMYPVGSALAQIISTHESNLEVNVSASNGSPANVRGISEGQFDLALISADVAGSAFSGTGEFEDSPQKNLRAIAAIYSSISNWMAPDSTRLIYVHDLYGRSVAVGPQNSASELAARMSLLAVGIDEGDVQLVNFGLGSGGEEVKSGKLEAIHGFAGVPISGLTELAQSTPCRLLKYTEKELDEILSSNPFYYRTVIPSGTYPGQKEDVETFGIKCLLCVDISMDEELVYNITRILDEARPELSKTHKSMCSLNDREFMYSDIPVPLHPGAKQYYEDTGISFP